MYIVIIFCLNSRQNQCKFNFLASQYREVWEILIKSITQYQYWLLKVSTFTKFPKMPYKLLKYWQILWSLLKFRLFSSLGTATHIIWLHFGKLPLFPLNFGSLAVKAMAFLKILSSSS